MKNFKNPLRNLKYGTVFCVERCTNPQPSCKILSCCTLLFPPRSLRPTPLNAAWSWSSWRQRACVRQWSAAGSLLCRRLRWSSWSRSTSRQSHWPSEMEPTMSAWSKVSAGQRKVLKIMVFFILHSKSAWEDTQTKYKVASDLLGQKSFEKLTRDEMQSWLVEDPHKVN